MRSRGSGSYPNLFSCAVALPSGEIYALPCKAKQVLRIDGATGGATSVGPDLEDVEGWKYRAAAVLGGFIYAPPDDSSRMLRINTKEGTVETFGPDLHGTDKYSRAVVVNGTIYGVPDKAARVLRVGVNFRKAVSSALPASFGSEEAQRAINRWGLDIASVLTGTHSFFPEGFRPKHGPEDCLKHVEFEGRTEVVRRAREATALQPVETRGHKMVIYAYTMESPLYRQLTASMRLMDETALKMWRHYIFHMSNALSRQPLFKGTAYRGIDVLVPKPVYEPGTTITWQSFSSATKNVFSLLRFLKHIDGDKLFGTVFVITAYNARCVWTTSAFPKEEEVILGANTHMKVEAMVTEEVGKRALLPQLQDYNLDKLKVFRLKEL